MSEDQKTGTAVSLLNSQETVDQIQKEVMDEFITSDREVYKADNTIRASLKAKMLAAGPNNFIEIDFSESEMLWLSNPVNLASLVGEVEAELAQRNSKAEARVYSPSEAGLAAMAGAAEPDHAAHLRLQDEVKRATLTFEEVVTPLMKYLADHHHPYVTVIVTSTTAEMVEGMKGFNTNEFIKD